MSGSTTDTFSYAGDIQTFTITSSGEYQITAEGAAGGNGSSGAGGLGAEVSGDFYLTAGETLEIVVGGQGGSSADGGGGGGGSFVFVENADGSLTPLVVAGGGGGGSFSGSNGDNGETGETGDTGINMGGAGGVDGAAGAGGNGNGDGGGGGGGYEGGNGGQSSTYATTGSSAPMTFAGGTGIDGSDNGGFGGGGGGGYNGGGGGGGYGGGGGGGGGQGSDSGTDDGGGGGGGSYDSGTNAVETAGVNSGNGAVSLSQVLCFCAGTLIATPDGHVTVEDLKAGDLVLTASGEAKQVRWLGRSDISATFADPLKFAPVRIKAGALGENLPVRDLCVSPAHAIFVGGLLIQAAALVNGVTIVRDRITADFSYYHVELETHELLLSEGLATESFVDNVSRMAFSNWAERTAPEVPIAELPYPRAKSARQVPAWLRLRVSASA